MRPVARRLTAHGYEVFNVDYPSTTAPIPVLAAGIATRLALVSTMFAAALWPARGAAQDAACSVGYSVVTERVTADRFIACPASGGERRLAATVLYRGRAGWVKRPGRGTGLGGGEGLVGDNATTAAAGRELRTRGVSSFGGGAHYDPAGRTLWVLGRAFSLGDTRGGAPTALVVLVDRVDSVGGPPVVAGTARIAATLPPELQNPSARLALAAADPATPRRSSLEAFAEMLRRSAEVRAFLTP